jgi:hypothetical protein
MEDTYDFLCHLVGKENIISAPVHMDESTPHMQAAVVPFLKVYDDAGTEIGVKLHCTDFWAEKLLSPEQKAEYKKAPYEVDKKGNLKLDKSGKPIEISIGKWAYQKRYDGAALWTRLHDKYHAFMAERGHDLDRGDTTRTRGEKEKDLDGIEYQERETKKEVAALREEKADLESKIEPLQDLSKRVDAVEIRTAPQLTLTGKKMTIEPDEVKRVEEIVKQATAQTDMVINLQIALNHSLQEAERLRREAEEKERAAAEHEKMALEREQKAQKREGEAERYVQHVLTNEHNAKVGLDKRKKDLDGRESALHTKEMNVERDVEARLTPVLTGQITERVTKQFEVREKVIADKEMALGERDGMLHESENAVLKEAERLRVAGENLRPSILAQVESEFAEARKGLEKREADVKDRESWVRSGEQIITAKGRQLATREALTALVKTLYGALERICAGYMIAGKGQYVNQSTIKNWLVPLVAPVAEAAEKARAGSGGGPIPPFSAGKIIEYAVRKELEKTMKGP